MVCLFKDILLVLKFSALMLPLGRLYIPNSINSKSDQLGSIKTIINLSLAKQTSFMVIDTDGVSF